MTDEIENLIISAADLKNGVPALRSDMLAQMRGKIGSVYDGSDKVVFTDAVMAITSALSRMSGFIEIQIEDARLFDETTREISFGKVEGKARIMRQDAYEVILRHLSDEIKKINLEGVMDGSAFEAHKTLQQQGAWNMLFFIPMTLQTDLETVWQALEDTLGRKRLEEVAEKTGHAANPKAMLEMPVGKLLQELQLDSAATAKFVAALSPEPVQPEKIQQSMKAQNIENMAELFARFAAGNDNIMNSLSAVREKAQPPKNQFQEIMQQLPEPMQKALAKAVQNGALTGLEFVRIAESGGIQITLKQAMEILKTAELTPNGVLNAKEVTASLAALPNAKPAPEQGAEKGGGVGR